jgi:hypothetical protein
MTVGAGQLVHAVRPQVVELDLRQHASPIFQCAGLRAGRCPSRDCHLVRILRAAARGAYHPPTGSGAPAVAGAAADRSTGRSSSLRGPRPAASSEQQALQCRRRQAVVSE